MPMPYSALSHLDCPRCGTRHDADRVQGTCACGSPLLARYDLRQVARQASPGDVAGLPRICGATTSSCRSASAVTS